MKLTNAEPDVQTSTQRWGRDWLRQLLLKHAHNHPNMPQDLVEKALVVVCFANSIVFKQNVVPVVYC